MRRSGFTLIELMIVIAIIAIISAIAIPSLLAAGRASNERNASGSLKSVLVANIDYKTNDRNGDTMSNFWCASISGLYTATSGTSNVEVRLIEVTLALADADKDQDGGGVFPADGTSLDGTATRPKAGYWYEDIETSETGAEYDPDDDDHNFTRFGYVCWPDVYNSTGSVIFIINQGGTMFRTGQCGIGSIHEVIGGSNMPNNVDVWPGGLAGPLSTGDWSTLD